MHIAFPFSVPEGQLRYDVADGVVRPEADQLAGACKNFFSVESWVDISNREYGLTWATANAPLVESGEITAEQPWMKSIKTSSSIYSYVMGAAVGLMEETMIFVEESSITGKCSGEPDTLTISGCLLSVPNFTASVASNDACGRIE